MGNLCCGELGAVNASLLTEMEEELPPLYKSIEERMISNPSTDIINFSIKKSFLKFAFDQNGKIMPVKASEKAPIFSEIVRIIEVASKKKFILIQIQNNLADQNQVWVVMANHVKLSRFDLLRQLSQHELVYQMQSQHIRLGDEEEIQFQMENSIREYYELHNALVLGCYQEATKPSTLVFLTVNYVLEDHEKKTKQKSSYFLSIKPLQESEIESFCVDCDQFIQSLIQIKGTNRSFIFALLKDTENIDINDSTLKVETINESMLKDFTIQYNQDIQNIFILSLRTYVISNIAEKRANPVMAKKSLSKTTSLAGNSSSPSKKSTQQNIQVEEEKKKADVPMELEYQEVDTPDSFLLDFQKMRGPYKIINENTEVGDLMCFKLAEFSSIKLKKDTYFYYDYEVPTLDQVQVKNASISNIADIKKYLKLSTSYLGVSDHWRVYKVHNRDENSVLLVSVEQKAIPSCMREVHFYKKFISKDEFYKREYVLKNRNQQISEYAVEVAQPLMSLAGLKKIWMEQELSERKNEAKSFQKLIYILFQVLTQIRNMQYQNIYHGSIDINSIFIDLRRYKVMLGNWSMIGQETKANSLFGIFKGHDQNASPKQNDIENIKNTFGGLMIDLQFQEDFGDEVFGLNLNTIDSIIKYLRQEGVKKLIEQFQNEEKDIEAFRTMKYDTLQPINELIEVEAESDLTNDKNFLMQTLETSTDFSTKIQASQKFFENIEIKEAYQQVKLQQLAGNSLIFGLIQNLVLQGETELALETINEFRLRTGQQFDIYSVFINIIEKDLLFQSYQLNEEEQLDQLPNIQQICLMIINSGNNELLDNAEATLVDLYNGVHPLYTVIQNIRNQEKVEANKFLPEYFVRRINVTHQLKETKEADPMLLAKALSTFKVIKNISQLMLYHETLSRIGQYQSEEPFFGLSLFIKDIFSSDYKLHRAAKSVLKEALELVASDELCVHVYKQLQKGNASDLGKSQLFKAHPMGRLNFFVKEFLFELNQKGKDAPIQMFETVFKQQYYYFFQNQLIEGNEFLEFLAMHVGLIEQETDKYRKYQVKFKA